MYLFFLSAEITDGILKLAPQKGEGIGTCRLRRFLESEKSSFVMHSSNLVIALNRFHEQCLLEDVEWKVLEIHNCTVLRNQYHISLIWHIFLQKRRLLIDLISAGAKIQPRHLDMGQSEAVIDFLCFRPPCPPPHLPTGILCPPSFANMKVARRTQRSSSTISRKNRGQWTVYCFTGCVAFTVAFTWLWPGVFILHSIYHTRQTVFHQDNQTPSREL